MFSLPASASSVAADVAEKSEKMLPKVDTILANMFEQTAGAIKGGAIWLQGQIPDVIKQFLMWKATEDTVYIVTGILVLIAGIIMSRIFWKLHNKANERGYYDGCWIVGVVFSLVLGIGIAAAIIIPNLLDLLEILVAPKVYLLEYAAHVYQTVRN